MMPGRYGLLIVIFAGLVWIARWLGVGGLRELDLVWLQVIGIAFCLGLAACIVGLLKRYLIAIQRTE